MNALTVTHNNHAKPQQKTTPIKLKKSKFKKNHEHSARPQNNIKAKPTTSNFENCAK